MPVRLTFNPDAASAPAAERASLQLLGNRFGNQLQLQHDVVLNVQAGGAHRAQRIAAKPAGIFCRPVGPLLQLFLDLAQPIEKEVRLWRRSFRSVQFQNLR
jgi:hypothetical protein